MRRNLTQPDQNAEFIWSFRAPCFLVLSQIKGRGSIRVAGLHLHVAAKCSILVAYQDVIMRKIFWQQRVRNAPFRQFRADKKLAGMAAESLDPLRGTHLKIIGATTKSSSSAETKRHRNRRRQGTRCIIVDVSALEISALVVRGYLPEEAKSDPKVIKTAIEGVISDMAFELQQERLIDS
jgi:hypothetical protein